MHIKNTVPHRFVHYITGSVPVPCFCTYSTIYNKKQKSHKGGKIMARVPMVTRTIIATKANVMCLDVQAGEPFNKVVTVPRTYKDKESLLKKVKPIIETDTIKAVHIVETEEIETLYGMTEQDFMEHATVLPPRNASEKESEQ